MSGKLVLIIGPSGVGKSVILKALRDKHPEFHFPRSATTRARRPGEGDDLYHFLTDAQFDEYLQNEYFLETATVHGGARYGTLLDEILPPIDQGKTVIREVDVQGFESIHTHPYFSSSSPRKYPLVSIFLLPESTEQLITHIQKRAPMEQDELDRRLQSLEKEMTYAPLCTAQVVSKEGHLDDAIAEVENIITA